MEKSPRIFLEHILECIILIEDYTQGKTQEDFLRTVELQDQVMRRLEIIGEAVRNLQKHLGINTRLFHGNKLLVPVTN